MRSTSTAPREAITVRVNVDESALTDPRFQRLRRYLSITFHEGIGRAVPVWMTAYNRRSAIMTTEDVDIAADLDGFAGAMVRADLAEQVDESHVRLRGVEDRIQFLLKQVAKARKRWDNQGNAGGDAGAYAVALPRDNQGNAGGDAYSLALDQSQTQDSACALADVAVAEINRLAGTRYQADSAGTLKDAKALAREGVTSDDLRRVIAAKWSEWSKSDQMRAQVKPSVLLRPSNFRKYREDLDARAPAKPSLLSLPLADHFVFDDDTRVQVPA
jgi:uncharacterized phage protein (TIGR02220 family)